MGKRSRQEREKDHVRNVRNKTEEEKVDRSPTAELCFQRVDAEE